MESWYMLDHASSVAELKNLAEELAELTRQHFEVLEAAAFIGVSQLDTREYHERRTRIGKLCQKLANFRQTT
jgi:hypothetical protein